MIAALYVAWVVGCQNLLHLVFFCYNAVLLLQITDEVTFVGLGGYLAAVKHPEEVYVYTMVRTVKFWLKQATLTPTSEKTVSN